MMKKSILSVAAIATALQAAALTPGQMTDRAISGLNGPVVKVVLYALVPNDPLLKEDLPTCAQFFDRSGQLAAEAIVGDGTISDIPLNYKWNSPAAYAVKSEKSKYAGTVTVEYTPGSRTDHGHPVFGHRTVTFNYLGAPEQIEFLHGDTLTTVRYGYDHYTGRMPVEIETRKTVKGVMTDSIHVEWTYNSFDSYGNWSEANEITTGVTLRPDSVTGSPSLQPVASSKGYIRWLEYYDSDYSMAAPERPCNSAPEAFADFMKHYQSDPAFRKSRQNVDAATREYYTPDLNFADFREDCEINDKWYQRKAFTELPDETVMYTWETTNIYDGDDDAGGSDLNYVFSRINGKWYLTKVFACG